MENILITKEKLLIKECLKKETYLSASKIQLFQNYYSKSFHSTRINIPRKMIPEK